MGAEDHGPTCAESPIDHACGSGESDQGVSWEEWSRQQNLRIHLKDMDLKAIASLHVQTDGGGGTVSGYCAECDHLWPCLTAHIANGWGLGDECRDAEWCGHAGMRMMP